MFQIQSNGTVEPGERIFTELPGPAPDLPLPVTKLPELPPRAPPPAQLEQVRPRPTIAVRVDPPHLERLQEPEILDNRAFLYNQFRELGIL